MSEFSAKHIGETGYELANAELERFVYNPALGELAALFGQEDLPEDTKERIAVLQQVGAEHWNFRKGAERQAVDWDEGLLDNPDSEVWNTVFDAASKLGMVESSKPQNANPDYLVILGGANKAPLDRLRYGLESVENVGEAVVYLGASRQVSDAEREKARDYAPDAQTEFDLGCGAVETLLGARVVGEVKEVRKGDVWVMRHYEYDVKDDEGNVVETKNAIVANTPVNIHDNGETRRATTYDNYSFFARQAELAKYPETSVVAVTTGFYVPAQHFPGVQELTLKYGVDVETIGHDAAYSGVTRKPAQLLQETKAAIDASARLHDALNTAA